MIAETPGEDLHRVLAMWALPDGAWAQINADFDRIEAAGAAST
ncbi:hypothetical protein [Streptomyces sp. NBC_00690]|nr:hypothetical protein [Streptomyces sp. NBC_00690]